MSRAGDNFDDDDDEVWYEDALDEWEDFYDYIDDYDDYDGDVEFWYH